jgi:antitoxin CcdA
MQVDIYNPRAPRKAANLSINSDLLGQAKEKGINLSKVLEQRLVELLVEEKRRAWREENRSAIEAYNFRIEEDGVFSDGLRRF